MNIAENVSILKKRDGLIIFKYNGKEYTIDDTHPMFTEWEWLYSTFLKFEGKEREDLFTSAKCTEPLKSFLESLGEDTTVKPEVPTAEKLAKALGKLIDFFREFDFAPNFRFVNTLSFKLKEGDNNCAIDYVRNYFSLIDSPHQTSIMSKVNSPEFKAILNTIRDNASPKSHINTRFAIYYGSAGTGKTTLAMQESDNRCIVCNASMLPSDLMEDFVFKNGEPSFQKSSLWECMENGKPIVLDEINLLPFDSLRFLQGILDGKKEFDYKGHKVTITDGFKIIGTMNLSIGGMIYGLPEPLIDRCADMREFTLTAEQLLGAVM